MVMHVTLGLGKQQFLDFLDVAELLAAFFMAFIFQVGLAVDALVPAIGVQIFYFTTTNPLPKSYSNPPSSTAANSSTYAAR